MRLLIAGLILVLTTVQTLAQSPLTPERLWELGRIGSPVLSEDGLYLFYTIRHYNLKDNSGQSQIYLQTGKEKFPKAITQVKGGIGNIIVKPNSKTIGYIHNGQLWEMEFDGSNVQQVSNFKMAISNVKYSPDGQSILFTYSKKIGNVSEKHMDMPDANYKIYDDLMFRHWDSWADGQVSHPAYATLTGAKDGEGFTDILGDEAFSVPTVPFGGAEDLIWGPEGKSILYVCKKKTGAAFATSTNTDIYQYDLATKKTTNLTASNKGYDTHPVLSSDGTQLAYLSMTRDGYESDKNDLIVLDLKSGKRKNLTQNQDLTVGGFDWSKDNQAIWISSPEKGVHQIKKVLLDGTKIESITSAKTDYRSVIDAGDFLVLGGTTMNRAKELYRMDKKTKSITPITHVNDELYSDIQKSKIEERWITTTDGKKMHTWVIYPPNFDPEKKYPTLLYCQGGPQSMVSQFYSYRWNFQLMAAQGYIVVAPNRRGLPGFGQEWNEKISTDWGGQSIRDYLTAIDEVAKEPFVDNDRIGAIGASYGGYSVYYLAGVHEKRFKTFIAHCGLFNLESWYGSTEELFFANFDIGGPYWAKNKPKSYEAFSPHKKVQNWDTPIMVIHGGRDYRVPDTQGMEAYTAARLLGLKSRFLYFPQESHWVLSPQNGIIWHREFFNWLKETL